MIQTQPKRKFQHVRKNKGDFGYLQKRRGLFNNCTNKHKNYKHLNRGFKREKTSKQRIKVHVVAAKYGIKSSIRNKCAMRWNDIPLKTIP